MMPHLNLLIPTLLLPLPSPLLLPRLNPLLSLLLHLLQPLLILHLPLVGLGECDFLRQRLGSVRPLPGIDGEAVELEFYVLSLGFGGGVLEFRCYLSGREGECWFEAFELGDEAGELDCVFFLLLETAFF